MASTAELEAEILADLEENPDAYTAPVNDVITIDPETKIINLPSSEVLFGTEEEQGVERKYFKCPRIVGDNIDLFTHQIYISYMAVKDKNATFIPDSIPQSYWCDDVALDETGNCITFSWLLSGNVLASRGFVGFAVIAKSVEGDILKTRWKTAPAVGTVLMTLPDAGEGIAELYPDIITQLLDRMDAVEEIATAEAMQGYVDDYLERNPLQLDSTLTDPEKAAPADMVGELRGDLVNVNVSLLVFNIHNGYWTTRSGSKSPYEDACSTDPILVKSGQKYEIISDAYDNAVAYILFNSDGTVNSYENNTEGGYSPKKYSLTIPDGVTKMICSCVTKDNGPFSVKRIIENEKGIVPDILNRLDYAEEQLSSINTETGNKNLKVLNEFSLIDDYKSISFEYTNQYLNSFGVPTSFENSRLTDFIDISDCDSILVTANCADGSKAYVFYDENKNKTEEYPPFGETLNESLIDKKVSIPISAKYIRVSTVYSTNVSVKKRVSLTESYNDFDERISTLETSNVTDVLSGKKYVSCGDSFTQGDFTGGTEQDVYDNELKCYKTYPYWIAKRNNMTLVNEALCGSCLTHIEGKTNALSDTRYTLIPDDADYITIRIGLNDSSAKVSIGTIDDTENTTFYGAWNVVLDYLTLNRPNAKIGIIVESAYLPTEYRNACINVAQKWGIPYLDLYNDDKVPCIMGRSGVSNTISNRRYAQYRVSESNGHPNMLAHKTMSTFIENFLRSL